MNNNRNDQHETARLQSDLDFADVVIFRLEACALHTMSADYQRATFDLLAEYRARRAQNPAVQDEAA